MTDNEEQPKKTDDERWPAQPYAGNQAEQPDRECITKRCEGGRRTHSVRRVGVLRCQPLLCD